MRRPLALLLAIAFAAAGCAAPPPMTDPFRRARIPPPGTGQLGPAAPNAYGPPATVSGGALTPVMPPPPMAYGGQPPAVGMPAASPTGMSSPPVYQTPPPPPPFSGAPPPGGSPYAPPSGGWAPQSSRDPSNETPAVKDNFAMRDEVHPLAESVRPGRLSAVARGRTADEGAEPGEIGMAPLSNSDASSAAAQSMTRRPDAGVVPVSYQAPVTTPPRTVGGAFSSAAGNTATATRANRPAMSAARGPADQGATYGYDSKYAWLQGQLEYSEATRQWKLRYIPIDGPTDRYGGSVVLAPSPALDAQKAGAFVSVKGKLDDRASGQGSFAPLYTISNIDRLSD